LYANPQTRRLLRPQHEHAPVSFSPVGSIVIAARFISIFVRLRIPRYQSANTIDWMSRRDPGIAFKYASELTAWCSRSGAARRSDSYFNFSAVWQVMNLVVQVGWPGEVLFGRHDKHILSSVFSLRKNWKYCKRIALTFGRYFSAGMKLFHKRRQESILWIFSAESYERTLSTRRGVLEFSISSIQPVDVTGLIIEKGVSEDWEYHRRPTSG
jgi:hypothetical protein